jgi:hypothetical protein
MRLLIKRLKTEKIAIEKEKRERYESQADQREKAYNVGKTVAKNWIKHSSYEEIIGVLHHKDGKRDDDSFGSKIHIYFKSIEKVCPEEAQEFKWVYNDSFINGWRDGVSILWNSIRRDVDE